MTLPHPQRIGLDLHRHDAARLAPKPERVRGLHPPLRQRHARAQRPRIPGTRRARVNGNVDLPRILPALRVRGPHPQGRGERCQVYCSPTSKMILHYRLAAVGL